MRKMLLGLCAVTIAAAFGSGAAGAMEKAKAKNDPNKVVCRNVSESGSRLKSKRVCHTNAQWAEIRREAKEQIDHIQNTRPASGN
ncbi:MAG TPA: hypothetical protein VIT45_17135 [Allosphingosinicella sp.]